MKSPKLKLALALLAMFLLGAFSGVGLFSFCHFPFGGPPGQQEMQDHLVKFLTERLNLTADEQAKIKPIAADFARQAQALGEQSATQFEQLAEATDARVALLVTPEQKAALAKIRLERLQIMKNHGGMPACGPGGPGGPPPEPDGSQGTGAPLAP